MDNNEKYTFKTRADIEVVKKERDRISVRYGIIGAGVVVIGCCINATTDIMWGITPLTSWMESKYRWDFWIIFCVVVGIVSYFYEGTKMRQRDKSVYRAARVADAFKKAELFLKSGMISGSVKMVREGLERLEAIKGSFAEMEEYQELIVNGRAWLRECEIKGSRP